MVGTYDIAERTMKNCYKDSLCYRFITYILSFISQRIYHTLNIMTSSVDTKYMVKWLGR